ncbi:DnaT-like ssDNA-binding domain-containing protein [Pseudomonas oryzihabitans]|uniref:DnaT-like ssDNA-binding domain-containing protein n=1 Tax=Pseudomonas oryzihabitans TaxID=47885 RepID=UPI0016437D52|nr:DnaT-like ssDNA-binding domain-containing protein [Pseudomonas oryzihabitans]
MTAVLVNDDEWALFAGEPAELLKLYVSLKRRMDFASGIAGLQTKINEIVLREGFTVDPIPGRPAPKAITREQYRSAVRRMEKIGAVKVIGPLVFEFPHARTDQSAQKSYNRATTELQPAQQPNNNQQEPINGAGSSQEEGGAATGLFSEQPASNNLLPESGNKPPSSSPAKPEDRFAMHDGWEPTLRGWKATAMRNGLGNTPVQPDELLEFRSYWITRPDKFQSQGQWEHEFAQKIIRGNRHAQANPGRHQAQARSYPSRGGSLSAVDRVKQSIADRKAREAAAGAAGQALDEDGGDVRPPLDVEFWRES